MQMTNIIVSKNARPYSVIIRCHLHMMSKFYAASIQRQFMWYLYNIWLVILSHYSMVFINKIYSYNSPCYGIIDLLIQILLFASYRWKVGVSVAVICVLGGDFNKNLHKKPSFWKHMHQLYWKISIHDILMNTCNQALQVLWNIN